MKIPSVCFLSVISFIQALREGDLSTALDRLHALNDMYLARSGLHLFRQMDERRTISNSSSPVDTNTIDLDSRIFELTSRSFLDPVFRFSARIREIPSLARVVRFLLLISIVLCSPIFNLYFLDLHS